VLELFTLPLFVLLLGVGLVSPTTKGVDEGDGLALTSGVEDVMEDCEASKEVGE